MSLARMRPSLEYLRKRLSVNIDKGVVTWIDATKSHRQLNGCEAGSPSKNKLNGKSYWYIKVDKKRIKRAHIVFLFATGRWPQLQMDHISGYSLDDRYANLREVTSTQNAWNHKKRAKRSDCPMGVKELPSGRYIARIACNKKTHTFGPYKTAGEASMVYQNKRKEFFNDYA